MTQNGVTALMWAVRFGDSAMVTQLLYRGACIDLADKVDALLVVIVLWRRRSENGEMAFTENR